MSAFTDEDLKRLQALTIDHDLQTYDTKGHRLDDDIKALVARLEAAEACCELTWFHFGQEKENPVYANGMSEELGESAKAWRKSCGK